MEARNNFNLRRFSTQSEGCWRPEIEYNSQYIDSNDIEEIDTKKGLKCACEGCIFYLIFLILIAQATLLVLLLLWRFFDLDIFPEEDINDHSGGANWHKTSG